MFEQQRKRETPGKPSPYIVTEPEHLAALDRQKVRAMTDPRTYLEVEEMRRQLEVALLQALGDTLEVATSDRERALVLEAARTSRACRYLPSTDGPESFAASIVHTRWRRGFRFAPGVLRRLAHKIAGLPHTGRAQDIDQLDRLLDEEERVRP